MSTTINSFLSMLQIQVMQVSLLILVVGLVSWLLRNRHPHLVFALWAVVFVKCLTPPIMVSPVGVFAWQAAPVTEKAGPDINWSPVIGQFSGYEISFAPEPKTVVAETGCDSREGEINLPENICQSAQALPALPVIAAPVSTAEQPTPQASALAGNDAKATPTSTVVGAAFPWRTTLFLVWLSGVLTLLAVSVWQWTRCWSVIRDSRIAVDPGVEALIDRVRNSLRFKRPVRLVVTESGYGPLVFGYLRPVLVLPKQIVDNQSPSELEPVVAHELIHVRRGDTLLCLMQFLAQTLMWFNPLVWWASRQANRVCERCCDLEVVNGLKCKPAEYAKTLVDILELRHRLCGIAVAAGIRPVDITASRLLWLTRRGGPGPQRVGSSWLVATVTALLVYPGAGIARAPQEHPADATATTGAVQEYPETAKPVHPSESTTLAHRAHAAFQRGDWKTASDHYQKMLDTRDGNGTLWFRLGYALHAQQRLDEAIVAHQKATEFPGSRKTALYNLACAFCLKGDHEEALNKLDEALDAGFALPRAFEDDSDFASLLENEHFQELSERHQKIVATIPTGGGPVLPSPRIMSTDGGGPRVKARAKPVDPSHRQLDFWLGQWTIGDADGNSVGTSVVTKQDDDLRIHQSWNTGNGDSGKSINYYDPEKKVWVHNRVEADGSILRLAGFVQDDRSLQLTGNASMRNGETARCRMSVELLDDGRIHQLLKISTDDGQTWETRVDRFHSRINEEDRP